MEKTYLYTIVLTYISKFSGVQIDLIENLLGTLTVFAGFYFLKLLLQYLAMKKLTGDYCEEVISDIIPSVLRLVSIGFLAKIWMTGEASIESTFEISKTLMTNIVQTFYVFLFYLGAKFTIEVIVDINYSNSGDKQYNFRRTTYIVLGLICFFLLLKIWLNQTANFSTYLGLLSAGLAIALQDVITSIAGWVYILTVKPLSVGNRIQIGDKTGDITDIKFLQFSLLETGNWVDADQPTGRILYFPNSFVFKNSIANYDGGFEYIFSEMPITITFESDWKKARKILQTILHNQVQETREGAARQIRKASREMKLQFSHLDPRVILSVADCGVVLTLRFLCKVRERRFQESRVWEGVLSAFADEPSIDFAYPTMRYYNNLKEGKSGAGGPSPAAALTFQEEV